MGCRTTRLGTFLAGKEGQLSVCSSPLGNSAPGSAAPESVTTGTGVRTLDAYVSEIEMTKVLTARPIEITLLKIWFKFLLY